MLIQAALWKPSEYSVEEYNKYVVSLMLPAQKERSVPFVVLHTLPRVEQNSYVPIMRRPI